MAEKLVLPHGQWPSPITPALIGASARLDEVSWDADGETLLWLEGRSGRGMLMAQADKAPPRELSGGQNVRGGLMYGGGEFQASRDTVVFADKDGRLYAAALDGSIAPRPITPPGGRTAAPRISPDGRWVAYVHTDGSADGLYLVPADGSTQPLQLASGADFYMQPVWNMDGSALAWVEWDHPNMPWDGSRLVLARFQSGGPGLSEPRVIAGGPGVPVFQPEFSPDGRWLSWAAGDGEWDSLWLLDLQSGEAQQLLTGRPLMEAPWLQGMRTIAWSYDSRRLYWIENQAGFSSLWRIDLQQGPPERMSIGSYTWIRQIAASPRADRLALIAAATGIPDQVVIWEAGRIRVIRRSLEDGLEPEEFSQPRPLEWTAPDGSPVYGLFYPPASPRYRGQDLPPVIVHPHGGPSTLDRAEYEPDLAFFTSRGYAWLSVNYRGSTGYGRSYQRALYGRWGELDVEDTLAAARALAGSGLIDPRRLVAQGSSAGGFTVLNALARAPGIFRAGLVAYPVTDLITISQVTFKFEQRYIDRLVGPLPQAADLYRTRSPLQHAAQIRDPLALFQGDEDEAVPQQQAEALVDALRANGVPHLYRCFSGEGHGFRKAENVALYYQQMEDFLRQYVLTS